MSFLTAEWRKLAVFNYLIDKDILLPYLPAGTELDLWNGKCYVSLVGFLFQNTKLLGFAIPFHTIFEEVNLRFYVRYNNGNSINRGVVFIKEIVPRIALSLIANTFYNENYESTSMYHNWSTADGELIVTYGWYSKGVVQEFTLTADGYPEEINSGSEAEFITEHYWGYTYASNIKTYEYEVRHPRWLQYKVNEFEINVDFGLNYGDRFKFLNDLTPVSVLLAEGSEISVERKRVIKFKTKERHT